MRRFFLVIVTNILIVTFCLSQDIVTKAILPADTSRVRIIFAGDMMGHMPLVKSVYNDSTKTYDYTPVFEYIKPYINTADIAIVNLEVTLAGPPYLGYPQFSSPDAVADGLKKTGFNLLITANNHVLDHGKEGFERTIRILDSLKIMHTGTFKDSLQKARLHPLFVEKNKIKFGFLNYTYGTNSYKTQRPNIVNYIDTSNIRRDIQLCKTQQADIIIVTIHWGTEYERYPDKEQQDIAELVRKCGANAVIGSHPHVIQPIKLFQNIHDSAMIFPVVFSLGNFVSNQRDRYRDGGIIFELDIEKTNTTKIKSCSYLPIWVYKGNINGKLSYKLISPDKFNSASNTLKFGETDSLKCQVFFNDTRLHLNNIPETGTEKWSYLMVPRQ